MLEKILVDGNAEPVPFSPSLNGVSVRRLLVPVNGDSQMVFFAQ